MDLEFPYQITTFLTREPLPGEPVFYGPNGWYSQVTLKRRFKLNGMAEDAFINKLQDFFTHNNLPTIKTDSLTKPERMPVHVITVSNQAEMQSFHMKFVETFKDALVSKYPERDGDNYYPHITVEYNDEFVLPIDEYTDKEFSTSNIWLLKDVTDEDSIAYTKIC